MPTDAAKRRLQALSEQLVAPVPDQGSFEDIPKLKKIAPSSTGQRVKGKVVIVTGLYLQPSIHLHHVLNCIRNELSYGHWPGLSSSICTEWC